MVEAIAQNAKIEQKNFSKILRSDVTWSDEQMVASLEVTVTSQVMVTWKEVNVISSSDKQMIKSLDYIFNFFNFHFLWSERHLKQMASLLSSDMQMVKAIPK